MAINNLTHFKKIHLALSIVKRKTAEYLQFDSTIFRIIWALFSIISSFVFILFRRQHGVLYTLANIHRRIPLPWASFLIEKISKRRYFETRGGYIRLKNACDVYLKKSYDTSILSSLRLSLKDQKHFFYRRLIVVKSFNRAEKGVIIIKYTSLFRSIFQLFDINKICERYHLVLEPSWSGYFDLDILSYATLDCPIFIQALEPWDYEFIKRLSMNLIPVPIGANWWVDHRIFKPLNGEKKEFDVIMIARWINYKRHYRIFEALNNIKKRGKILLAIFIGEPLGKNETNKNDIYQEAKYYDIHRQIELIEKIPQQQINYYLNCSKVNILWSRKEGVNKTSVEGMFAGVPCILRKGFNYGFKYPYINRNTGMFSSESALSDTILKMRDSYRTFSPRHWVMENMSCQKATNILNNAIKEVAIKQGEDWNTDIVTKVNNPNLEYWDEEARQRFYEDYEFLKSVARQ